MQYYGNGRNGVQSLTRYENDAVLEKLKASDRLRRVFVQAGREAALEAMADPEIRTLMGWPAIENDSEASDA